MPQESCCHPTGTDESRGEKVWSDFVFFLIYRGTANRMGLDQPTTQPGQCQSNSYLSFRPEWAGLFFHAVFWRAGPRSAGISLRFICRPVAPDNLHPAPCL